MNQRYVDTVRACKTLLRNLEHMEQHITEGQRQELGRLFFRLQAGLERFLHGPEQGLGLLIGEELEHENTP